MTTKNSLSTQTLVWALGLSALLIYMLLCAFGVTNTFWGWDSRHSSGLWKIVTVLCAGVAALLIYKNATAGASKGAGLWAGIAAILVFGFAASTGFKFTAGDIKQTVTCFQNPDGKPSLDGKVNPDCLKEYYNDFYKFDTDTALWNYVVLYKELPGVNLWAFNIREGKTPPSAAPRANEDFKYHTGAYEMDLSK